MNITLNTDLLFTKVNSSVMCRAFTWELIPSSQWSTLHRLIFTNEKSNPMCRNLLLQFYSTSGGIKTTALKQIIIYRHILTFGKDCIDSIALIIFLKDCLWVLGMFDRQTYWSWSLCQTSGCNKRIEILLLSHKRTSCWICRNKTSSVEILLEMYIS